MNQDDQKLSEVYRDIPNRKVQIKNIVGLFVGHSPLPLPSPTLLNYIIYKSSLKLTKFLKCVRHSVWGEILICM